MSGSGCLSGCGIVLLSSGAMLFLFPVLFAFFPVFGPIVATAIGLLSNPLAWFLMAVGGCLVIAGLIFRDDE